MNDDDIQTLKDAVDRAVAEANHRKIMDRRQSFVEMYQQMVASREASMATAGLADALVKKGVTPGLARTLEKGMSKTLLDGGSYTVSTYGGYHTHTVTYDPAREMKRYMVSSSSGTVYPDAVSAAPAPLARVARHVKVSAMSNGAHPEVGMRVKHEGTTFEIERIEIETPSWRVVAIGHAVGDRDTFSVSRLRLRVPVDELEPADIETKENAT